MKVDKMKQYVRSCVYELMEKVTKLPVWLKKEDLYDYESYFHADLYVILNKKDEKFWDTVSVAMGDAENFKGVDLVISDIDREKKKKPYNEIFLEIKHWCREGSVNRDLEKLKRKKHSMFLYISKNGKDEPLMEKRLKKFSEDYKKTEILYMNMEIEDEPKLCQILNGECRVIKHDGSIGTICSEK